MVSPPDDAAHHLVLTLALERSDGIERVVFRCRIARALLDAEEADADRLVARLRPWIERDFEQTREAALKSIRTQCGPLEMVFDSDRRGPF